MRVTRIEFLDSHTGGEPTRLVVAGGPDLGKGSLSERLERFRNQFDDFRSTVIHEPRGSDVLVGALLCEPSMASCIAGVIFFNNVGYLGMCGHGTLGLMTSLAHLGRITPGQYSIETPVGVVRAELHESGSATVENVPSFRSAAAVPVDVPGYGVVRGDVAWGGNWFFLVGKHPIKLALECVEELTDFAWAVRKALAEAGVTGNGGAEIDHIELFGPPVSEKANSRNFVLCPGKAYDRSPCGTGTSAKLACLHADGLLREGDVWLQEGILGTVFKGTIALTDKGVVPSISGSAYITAQGSLIVDSNDPFRQGIRS